jgi:hypothetical protein
MKRLSPFLLILLTALFSRAQAPPIAHIDLYGLRIVTEQQIRSVLQLKEGDAIPDDKAAGEIIKRLKAVPNVEDAALDFPCCDEKYGKTILYVGIREKGTPALRFRSAPVGDIRLPAEMLKLEELFYDALGKAVIKGDTADDDSQGHSLMANPAARAVQEQFITVAANNGDLLRKVLRRSSDAHHRALAAQIIAYSSDKHKIIGDLIYAIKDPSDSVRNAAVRALAILARYAQTNPQMKLKVSFTPFIDLLNSIVWTDRNKSSLALFPLTDGRDPKLLKELKTRALPSLLEMARWQSKGHAFGPLMILGRIAGISDTEIIEAMQSEKRDTIIEKAKLYLDAKKQ